MLKSNNHATVDEEPHQNQKNKDFNLFLFCFFRVARIRISVLSIPIVCTINCFDPKLGRGWGNFTPFVGFLQ